MEAFLNNCTSCGLCRKVCPFLREYGLPSEIIKIKTESVFLCTNCRACDRVCPESLHPSEALLSLKYELIKEDRLSEDTKKAILSSRAFAMRGHRFPFVYYSRAETVFWPGCSLQGTRPDLVRTVLKNLKIRDNKTGLVLDCCFDPAYQNGDLHFLTEATERIRQRLSDHGIKRVITGCTNCLKIFRLYMPEIETIHVLEALPQRESIPERYIHTQKIYLHHPCPSFRFDEIREAAKNHISSLKTKAESQMPLCCGLGGLSHTSSDMPDKFTEKVILASGDAPVITYCFGCKNRFLKKGKESHHVLELITDIKPLKKPVSSKRKWLNRAFLSISHRIINRRFITGIVLITAIILLTYLRGLGYITPDSIVNFIKQHRFLAPAIFIFIYSIGPSVFLPSLPLTIASGFLWGPLWGVVFSITGATAGASVSFLLSRYILGDFVKARFGYSRWQWLKEKVERHGWKAVAFARLLPVLPFPVLNYLFGVTPIPFIHYLWSSLVFMLPACIAYVVFGSSMEELIIRKNISALIIAIIAVSLIMLMPFAFKRVSKKLLKEDER